MDNQDPSDGESSRAPTGKGKAKDVEDKGDVENSATEQDGISLDSDKANTASIFSRIARSGAGLGRELLSGPPSSREMALLASADKAGPSGPPVVFEHGRYQDGAAEPMRPFLDTATSSGARGGHAHYRVSQHAAQQEREFSRFLDGSATLETAIPKKTFDSDLRHESTSARAGGELGATDTESSSFHPRRTRSAVAEQESRDGQDVLRLLASGPAEEEPDYEEDINLDGQELEALRRALFGSDQRPSSSSLTSQEWDSVLNFIPEFVRPNPAGYEDEGAVHETGLKTHETQAALGMPHSRESTRLWLDQWLAVLTNYTDEVWGGLSPLVVQARHEVDGLRRSVPDAEPTPPGVRALERLRQVLGHLRGA